MENNINKPYTFEDLEYSLDLQLTVNKQREFEVNRLNKIVAGLKYDNKLLKQEALTQKILRLIPTTTETEGIMTAAESMKDYFKSKHTTFEDDSYIIGFNHEEDRNIIVFMWQDGKHSTKRKMYKKIMKYCLTLDKPIYYVSENNPFPNNSIEVSDNFYRIML